MRGFALPGSSVKLAPEEARGTLEGQRGVSFTTGPSGRGNAGVSQIYR